MYNDELMHYGIKGQKWGIRRYQNEDGSLTSAGRKKYRQEIKAENKKAFEYGRDATVAANAATYARNQQIKSQKKLDKALAKDPEMLKKSTQKKYKRTLADIKSEKEMEKYAKETEARAKKHCDSLIKKYGSENVKALKYGNYKTKDGKVTQRLNERVVTGKEFAKDVLVRGTIRAVFGTPVMISNDGGYERGKTMAKLTIARNRKEMR